jgi:hypothetical protein
MSPEEIIKNGAPLKVPFFMHITLKHKAQSIEVVSPPAMNP